MKRANNQNLGRKVSRRERNVARPDRRRLLMEGLEQRQLLAATPLADLLEPEQVAGLFRTTYFASNDARNDALTRYGTGSGGNGPAGTGGSSGSSAAFSMNEVEPNNTVQTSQLIPLGNQPGQQPEIDLSGSFPRDVNGIVRDVDYFKFSLKAGDIFNARGLGSASDLSLTKLNPGGGLGYELAGNDQPLGPTSRNSPLLVDGVASIATVIPEDGEYVLRVGTSFINGAVGNVYTVNLRTFRPAMEEQPIGSSQIVFLDFDGAVADMTELLDGQLGYGSVRIPSFDQSMAALGFQARDADRLIQIIIDEIEENFADLGVKGNNGSFDITGNAGEFKITILNSRDHADPWGMPNVSRMLIGGNDFVFGGGALGVAASVDIGNFTLEETAFIFPDDFAGVDAALGGFGPGASLIDFYGKAMGLVIAHEMGHYLGGWHTSNTNALDTIMDTGGDIAGLVGEGPDQLFGTEDDIDTDFAFDVTDGPAALNFYGYHDQVNALAFGLSTGKVGGTVTGVAYNDLNRSATRNNNEPVLAGATVFLDLDADGVFDSNEPSAITDSDGAYSLAAAAGTVLVRTIAPAGFTVTTTNPVSVTVPLNGSAAANFGYFRVQAGATGFKWADVNGNGLRDVGEPGIEGVYIYLDLDGDDRIDLGEPQAITKADGSYSMIFPGNGTYTMREVVPPGFRQTFPASGEHIVTYSGSPLTDNYNFGNTPVQDFGDAPAPYPTTVADNGAIHGLVAGLSLGALVDTEGDGQPNATATGDDAAGDDDEDGVTLLSPLSPGATGALSISVTNTTGAPAYVSAWIDLNRDGDWTDAGEKFITDMVVNASGVFPINVTLPSTALIGQTFARFRLSQSPGIGITGFTGGGEVEDHAVMIASSPELANDDAYDIPRGSLNVPLDVLGNDFDLTSDPLTIVSIDTTGTLGQVIIAQDRRSLFYTPRNNALGPDSFTYTVRNASGTLTGTATVDLSVVFQSQVPIAIDDSFNLPQGSANQPINVLANDIPSVAGGTRIIATSSPDAGGTVTITSGGQSLRYTPAAGFNGTEQFTYTVGDALGQISTATVTIHLQPGATTDDIASFIVETFANDGVTPINTIPAGQLFKVRVSVDDLRNLNLLQDPGLGSAYLDLLYTDGLVANIAGTAGSGFPFGVQFGSLFSTVRTGDADIPGIFNEIGGTQAGLGTAHTGPVELFTITMLAVNPGIAEFIADPADAQLSDVVLLNPTNQELVPADILFGRRQLTIVPSGSDFTFAVDDSYPDQLDSNGNAIVAGGNSVLRVLDNDNFGPTGEAEIVNIGAATSGVIPVLNDNGTLDTTDDYIVYTAPANFTGVDQFTYTILSADGVQSTAEVTVTVGNAAADDLVDIQLYIVRANGDVLGPGDTLSVGEQFELRIMVDDLRAPAFGEPRGVFAAYMDLLYNSILAEPVDSNGSRFGFDVVFGDKFDPNTAVGDAYVPGLINEFGTFQTTAQGSGSPLQSDPVLLATIDMVAKAPGTLRVIADPADVSPFQDVLLFEPPNPVSIGQVRYDVAEVQIVTPGGGGEGENPYQNLRNRMDVNDDNAVSPIDALLVLNRLNRGGEGEDSTGDRKVFWDVNGDRKMSPIDALQIINFLNRNVGGAGEGEGSVLAGPLADGGSSSSNVNDFASAADLLFAQLGDDDKDEMVADQGQASAKAAAQSSCSPVTVAAADDDDDEDNGLQLLSDN